MVIAKLNSVSVLWTEIHILLHVKHFFKRLNRTIDCVWTIQFHLNFQHVILCSKSKRHKE